MAETPVLEESHLPRLLLEVAGNRAAEALDPRFPRERIPVEARIVQKVAR